MIVKQKCHLFSFCFYKNREQEGKPGPVWVVGTSGKREEIRRGGWRVNVVKVFCTYIRKWKKMRPVETILGMGREG
jgi:hypothetical protein